MSTQSDTKNSGQLRKAGGGTGDPPQERVQQLVVQCQMSNSGSIGMSNIIWSQQILFMNIYVYTSTCYMQ